MIVTCPGCSSKYRVRNESVPADGARMRCPKCETLFLAKPPADGSTTADDPSSLYQQLAPQGARGNSGAFPPVLPQPSTTGHAPGAPGVGTAHRGPVTALFAAADPSMLPPQALPPQGLPLPAPLAFPTPTTTAPPPGGLGAPDGPRVRTVAPSSVREPSAAALAAKTPPSRRAVIGSWAALGAGAFVFLCGSLTWAWTSEALPLDGALMPVARALFSAERPGEAALDAEALRRAASEATARKDLPAAIVAWRRVKPISDETDRRPSEALAKMLVALGEVP
ncbi:MAG: zinc-ribbon domain-containing protein [Deltaproteobacteria bacterium]|nr:zinc-ribbon domain-containing protein [Deltaproteobacteria bacterium]